MHQQAQNQPSSQAMMGQMQVQPMGQPQQVQQNVLLNQALGPIQPNQHQGTPVLTIQSAVPIGQPIQVTQGPAGIQIMNTQQFHQVQLTGQHQQPQILQGIPPTQQIQMQLSQLSQQDEQARQANSQEIKRLKEMLAVAQQKERQFQMTDPPQQQSGPPIATAPIRQQLQQHIHSNQQQQRMNLQSGGQNIVGVSGNPQLRSLLQQQNQGNVRANSAAQMQAQQQQQQQGMMQMRMNQPMAQMTPQQQMQIQRLQLQQQQQSQQPQQQQQQWGDMM